MSTTIVDRLGRVMPQWDKRQWDRYLKVLKLSQRGVPLTHDFSDEDEFEFVVQQHGGRDFLDKHYPATLTMLERARALALATVSKGGNPREYQTLLQFATPPVNQWQTANALIQSSLVQNGGVGCVADGLSTVIDGTYLTQMTVTLTDMSAGVMIGQDTVPSVYDRGLYVTAGTQGNLVQAGNVGMSALTVTYIPSGSQTPVTQTITSDVAQVCPTAPPAVTNPIHVRTQSPNPIKVALNRTQAQQPDCDYYYTTPQQGGRNPDVAVQVSGSANFQNPVCPLSFGTTLKGQLMLARRVNPAGAALILPSDQFAAGITPTGTQLGWSWGANNQFGAAPWDQGQLVDVILNMQVPVYASCTGQAPNAQANVASSQNIQPSACTTKIDPLLFVWGCLAAESMILMADGSRKPVVLVEPGELVVRDGHGRLALVTDKILGTEDRADSIRIKAGGMSIVVTQDHPMLAPRGPVRAGDLLVGSELCTRRGVVRVSDLVYFRYRNAVVNLQLRPVGDSEDARDAKAGVTHFADEFLVGDAAMQGSLRREHVERERDEKEVLANLPPEYHFDYVNLQRARRGEKLMTY